ncbi:DUF3307 domain-containing protein [Halomonas rhizosphaerae]|uniref:DUF3307 domain-containing protein n=1 Tax=Halomonas rhizosphaerae TaxID=3043296 RepID=A0ABT6V249_9GAMM|nr:DUF3307 domain-containing protein [Halomonas rhizosphaerae]MDI5892303.1 DUF3307 domain-containing protein [Halomonas rhizosphaerae]
MSANALSLLMGLVLAHLVGDFLLQPRTWVEERYRLRHRSPRLFQHAGLHGLLAGGVLLVASAAMPRGLAAVLLGALAVATSHWLIDLGKARLPAGELRWFLLDQAAHLLVLLGLWLAWLGSLAPLREFVVWLASPTVLGMAAAYLLVTRPLSIAIALVMQRWSEQLEETGTLASAGARIGVLERLLVLTLVLLDQLTAVGFLLAAKSVLRFGDLRDSRDRKLTEYVLLGTLLSVSTTLVLGMLVRLLLLEG